jgi:hypothetical protein
MTELAPQDPRRAGLVQWLFLEKKLEHWKSTRATAEVVYSLARYLEQEKQLGARQEATVRLAGQETRFVFEPERYRRQEPDRGAGRKLTCRAPRWRSRRPPRA